MSVSFQHIVVLFSCYVFFFMAEKKSAKANSHRLDIILTRNGSMDIWQLKSIYGLLLFGSGIIYYKATGSIDFFNTSFFLQGGNGMTILLMTIIFAVAVIYVASLNIRSRNILQQVLPTTSFLPYFALRIPFLILSELFFRGALLFAMTEIAGPVTGIIVSGLLYVLINLFMDKKKIILSLLTGFVLAMLCTYTQSVWPAVIIQLSITLMYETRLIKYSTTLKPNTK